MRLMAFLWLNIFTALYGTFILPIEQYGVITTTPLTMPILQRRCLVMIGTLEIALIAGIVVMTIVGFAVGVAYRKRVSEREIGSAETEATRLINEAIRSGESRKKEMLLEAKEEIHKSRTEYEKEVKEQRAELTKQERRLQQKEESLDKKTENFEKKEEELARRMEEVAKVKEETEAVKKAHLATLEQISGLSQEQAKQFLLKTVEEEIRHDTAMKIKEIEQELKDTSEEKAREILSIAIQRCAADHAAEATVSVVPLPNDEMKGRIIGREGRNIRTLETITGVDLIIDDTPEAITVSSFDPVRREVARLALEKLIADGRIHPTRIEDCVEKAKKDVDRTIREEGERACYETGVHGLNPELIKILGRQKYRTSYGQNVLNHSIEVAHIAGLMASELGVDVAMAKRAGLLHDLGKSIDHEVEGSHVQLGADLARKYKENPVVVNAIEAHHGDVEPKTVIAVLIQAADAVSAARPGARRENVENYIRRLQKLEELTGSYPGVEKAFAIQAGREVRIMVKPEEVTEDNMILLARDIAKQIEAELEYPGQIKINVIRETKAVEYAK
jgi:ribonuclease Y